MKRGLLALGMIVCVLLGFYGGRKFERFAYDDTCLDLGGGQLPGGGRFPNGYPICVIEKTGTH
jgi:hypothetical protein